MGYQRSIVDRAIAVEGNQHAARRRRNANATLCGTPGCEEQTALEKQLRCDVSISRSSLLERYERDARAAAKQVAMSPNHYIVGGRHRLGLDPSVTVF